MHKGTLAARKFKGAITTGSPSLAISTQPNTCALSNSGVLHAKTRGITGCVGSYRITVFTCLEWVRGSDRSDCAAARDTVGRSGGYSFAQSLLRPGRAARAAQATFHVHPGRSWWNQS